MRTTLKIAVMTAAALATLTTSAHASSSVDARHYSNQTTYGNATSSVTKAPPSGYGMFFIETVGRHGSRSLTDPAAEKRALTVWAGARRLGALTSVGRTFGRDVKAFQKAERAVGYGRLSTVGKAEWAGIGRRTAVSYAPFFSAVQSARQKVAFVTTPVYRTKQSASAMQIGLRRSFPDLVYAPRRVDTDLLISSGSTTAGRAAIARISKRPSVVKAAKHVLRRMYSRSYVTSLRDPVGKALDVYLLYCTAPGMSGDGAVTFHPYVSIADAKVLGYAKDAQNFYRYGPGVKGQTGSYRAAEPVLDDFFARLDARSKGGSTAAVFRLAHGETTMPFAALLKLPGSTKQATTRSPYAYGTNSWRGYVAGRLAGNIEWVAYRNASGHVLVTMRYNEHPVAFRSSCRPAGTTGYFYRPAELKRCLT